MGLISPLEADWVSPDIATDWLPTPIREWVDAVVTAWRVPAIMPVAAAMCALSAAVQGRTSVKINPKWSEPLTLFWFVLMPSGGGKSAVLRPAFKPLVALQAQLDAAFDEGKEDREGELESLRKALSDTMRESTKKGYRSDSPIKTQEQGELESKLFGLRARRDAVLAIKAPPRLFADNVTPQLIPKLLTANHKSSLGVGCLSMVDSEGRLIDLMLGAQTNDIDLSTLLKGYTGEPIDHYRSSRNTDDVVRCSVPEAHITMCVFAQSEYLDRLRASKEANERGLMGRLLLTNLPSVPEPSWNSEDIPEAVQRNYAACIQGVAMLPLPAIIDLVDEADWSKLNDQLPRGKGPEGWDRRVLGRIGRLTALCKVAEYAWSQADGLNALAKASDWNGFLETAKSAKSAKPPPGGCAGGEGSRVGEKRIEVLFSYLCTKDIQHLQALGRSSQTTGPTPTTLPRRALCWLCTFADSRAGDHVTAAQLRRGLNLSKERVTELVDELLESGHLDVVKETRSAKSIRRGEYLIRSLDPEAKPLVAKPEPKEQAKPEAERSWLDEADE